MSPGLLTLLVVVKAGTGGLVDPTDGSARARIARTSHAAQSKAKRRVPLTRRFRVCRYGPVARLTPESLDGHFLQPFALTFEPERLLGVIGKQLEIAGGGVPVEPPACSNPSETRVRKTIVGAKRPSRSSASSFSPGRTPADGDDPAGWPKLRADELRRNKWDQILLLHALMYAEHDPESCGRALTRAVDARRTAAAGHLVLRQFGY